MICCDECMHMAYTKIIWFRSLIPMCRIYDYIIYDVREHKCDNYASIEVVYNIYKDIVNGLL
jgi:hypothetical protein